MSTASNISRLQKKLKNLKMIKVKKPALDLEVTEFPVNPREINSKSYSRSSNNYSSPPSPSPQRNNRYQNNNRYNHNHNNNHNNNYGSQCPTCGGNGCSGNGCNSGCGGCNIIPSTIYFNDLGYPVLQSLPASCNTIPYPYFRPYGGIPVGLSMPSMPVMPLPVFNPYTSPYLPPPFIPSLPSYCDRDLTCSNYARLY